MVTLYINVRKKQKGQSRMDNPETLGIMGTQDTGRIHTTPDKYTRHRTNTHDTGRIHKTPDEYTRHRTNTQDTGRIHKTPNEYTRHRTNRQNNTTQQTKNMSKTVPPKIGLTQMLARGKQFLIRIRHPPCYRFDYISES